jgi:single-strand DNA-binding protein
MASLNKVFLMGNLTRNPELRYIPSGTAVASFGLAVNRVYNSQSGERKEEVCFMQIVAWARLAELCGEYLSKGSPVFVEGRLQSRSWEDQSGGKRSTIEVVASNVQFLGKPKGAGGVHAAEDAPDLASSSETMDVPPDNKPTSDPSGNASAEEAPF